MFPNATISSRSSSSRSSNSCSRNSSMPSLRMPNPLLPKTSFNPLYRNTDAFSSFDASNFIFRETKRIKEKRRPTLRRYNSHDSHTYFDFRIESKAITPNSTKSRSVKATSDSIEEIHKGQDHNARDFLEKYSLPRVVKVDNGEPLLLYRCFDSFTKVQVRGILVKKGKEKADSNILHFPEGYQGWFSLTNDKGEKTAVAHSSILHLVREQVCSFISMQSFTAYATSSQESSDGLSSKVHYLKTQIRGGQIFQLRAVFQHREKSENGKNSSRSSRVFRSIREKNVADRYAQLTDQNNQELYVPLTTKGEFYETYTTMKTRLCFPGLMDKTGPLALDKDCLYKLTHLLTRIALPVKVKLLTGALPDSVPKEFTDTFILEKKFQEPLMVTCTLPFPSENSKHNIDYINLTSEVKLSKCTLEFDCENRMFKSQRIQAALAFCHKNINNWYSEVRIIPQLKLETRHHRHSVTCTNCKKTNQSSDEKNGNDNGCRAQDKKQLITKQIVEKFPKPKKWYRHFKILGLRNELNTKFEDMQHPTNEIEKDKSMERYKDMSKLIDDKFGKKTSNPVKKSASFMYYSKKMNLKETSRDLKSNIPLLKCQSLDAHIFAGCEESKQIQMLNRTLRRKASNASDSFSNKEFERCILDNESDIVHSTIENSLPATAQSLKKLESNNSLATRINFNEIQPVENSKKIIPDLIPTLLKCESQKNSYITERLRSEFHVKTKIQKKTLSRCNILSSFDNLNFGKLFMDSLNGNRSFSVSDSPNTNTQSVIVQVHQESLLNAKPSEMGISAVIDDIPYSQVNDELRERDERQQDENVYAEICENSCNCDNIPKCQCERTIKGNSEYCYLKLDSQDDSFL